MARLDGLHAAALARSRERTFALVVYWTQRIIIFKKDKNKKKKKKGKLIYCHCLRFQPSWPKSFTQHNKERIEKPSFLIFYFPVCVYGPLPVEPDLLDCYGGWHQHWWWETSSGSTAFLYSFHIFCIYFIFIYLLDICVCVCVWREGKTDREEDFLTCPISFMSTRGSYECVHSRRLVLSLWNRIFHVCDAMLCNNTHLFLFLFSFFVSVCFVLHFKSTEEKKEDASGKTKVTQLERCEMHCSFRGETASWEEEEEVHDSHLWLWERDICVRDWMDGMVHSTLSLSFLDSGKLLFCLLLPVALCGSPRPFNP